MSAVFTKSAKSSAIGSFQSALFVCIFICVFGSIALFAKELPTFVKVIFAAFAFGFVFWVISLIQQGLRYLKSGKDWHVEVTDHKLLWQSPVQETMASFEVLLSDILTLRHVVAKTDSKRGTRSHDFTIELRNGEIIEVSDQISGVHPKEVFEAIHENGVPYAQEFVYTKEQIRERRNQKRARRRAAKAKRHLQTTAVVSGR